MISVEKFEELRKEILRNSFSVGIAPRRDKIELVADFVKAGNMVGSPARALLEQDNLQLVDHLIHGLYAVVSPKTLGAEGDPMTCPQVHEFVTSLGLSACHFQVGLEPQTLFRIKEQYPYVREFLVGTLPIKEVQVVKEGIVPRPPNDRLFEFRNGSMMTDSGAITYDHSRHWLFRVVL